MSKEIKNKVVYLPIDSIYTYERNPRTIKKADMDRLKKSIKDNPDYFEARPIIVSNRTGKNIIIAGNQRARAALELKMTEVPVVIMEGLSEERENEIMIRDNVNNGEWDMDALANEWDTQELTDWGAPLAQFDDIDFDNIESNADRQTEKKPIKVVCPDCGKEFEV